MAFGGYLWWLFGHSQCQSAAKFHFRCNIHIKALQCLVMATGSGSSALSSEQLSQVMAAVKGCMRDEIQSLKRELVEEKEASEERIVKRARLEKGPTFKKKAHEK